MADNSARENAPNPASDWTANSRHSRSSAPVLSKLAAPRTVGSTPRSESTGRRLSSVASVTSSSDGASRAISAPMRARASGIT